MYVIIMDRGSANIFKSVSEVHFELHQRVPLVSIWAFTLWWGEECNPIEFAVCCHPNKLLYPTQYVTISVCCNGMPPTDNGKCGQNCDYWSCDKGTCIPDTGFFQYASHHDGGPKTIPGVPQSVSEIMNDPIGNKS
jgi:hypothetical protein